MTNTAHYVKSKMVDNRTINYRFSCKTKKDVAYTDLVKVIKEHNEEQQELEALGKRPHYIRVRGRGRGPHTDPKTKVKYFKSIPDKLATYFDVYVVNDTDAMTAYEERAAATKTQSIAKTIVSKLRHFNNTNTSKVTA